MGNKRLMRFLFSRNLKRITEWGLFLIPFWRWYIRIILIWIVLTLVSPPNHRLYPDEQKIVETEYPQVCVHTALINEVDEWKMQQSLQLVRDMGATTIVEFFPWAYFEPHKGQYSWGQADRIVRHAKNQGIRIIARMGFVPAWARPEETTFNYIPEESLEDFAAFVATFAARYTGIINHIIIWNEPNLAFEWGYKDVDPLRYVRMLQTVYGPVHEANPNIVVLAGALAPTLEPPGSPHGLNDLLYLEALYEAGAAAYFDALAVHTYGLTQPPNMPPDDEQINFRRAELIHAIMQRYDDAHKPIYITESGWNDNTRWANGVRPSQRVTYTLAAYEWADEHWPWLDNLCMWIFRYPRLHHTHRDNFTFVNPDFQPKSIYFAVQAYARGWDREGALWLPPPEN
jgi:polysaccharide biosynthesis protein PslG